MELRHGKSCKRRSDVVRALKKKKKFLCVSGRPEEEALVGVGRRKVGEEASVALILV